MFPVFLKRIGSKAVVVLAFLNAGQAVAMAEAEAETESQDQNKVRKEGKKKKRKKKRANETQEQEQEMEEWMRKVAKKTQNLGIEIGPGLTKNNSLQEEKKEGNIKKVGKRDSKRSKVKSQKSKRELGLPLGKIGNKTARVRSHVFWKRMVLGITKKGGGRG